MKGHSRAGSRGNKGYALLFVLFLMALVLIGGSTAVLSKLTEGRREREAVMIWRGKQYQHAIARYYRKFGRFPTSVDDLVKVQNGEIRFLREAYKNPMNGEDGSWRFIYVTPSGQLIGSVQYTSLQQMAFVDQQRQMGLTNGSAPNGTTAADDSGNGASDQSGTGSANPGAANTNLVNLLANSGISSGNIASLLANGNISSSNISSMLANSGLSSAQIASLLASGNVSNLQIPPQLQEQLQQLQQQLQTQNSPQQQGSSPFFSQSQPGSQTGTGTNGGLSVDESSDTSATTDANGQMIGGFIVGVAGREDKPSIKFYKGGRTYKRWEFIFNPLEQVQSIGGLSGGPANPAGSQPNGQSQFPNQIQQPQIPQQQPQNPQQQQQQ